MSLYHMERIPRDLWFCHVLPYFSAGNLFSLSRCNRWCSDLTSAYYAWLRETMVIQGAQRLRRNLPGLFRTYRIHHLKVKGSAYDILYIVKAFAILGPVRCIVQNLMSKEFSRLSYGGRSPLVFPWKRDRGTGLTIWIYDDKNNLNEERYMNDILDVSYDIFSRADRGPLYYKMYEYFRPEREGTTFSSWIRPLRRIKTEWMMENLSDPRTHDVKSWWCMSQSTYWLWSKNRKYLKKLRYAIFLLFLRKCVIVDQMMLNWKMNENSMERQFKEFCFKEGFSQVPSMTRNIPIIPLCRARGLRIEREKYINYIHGVNLKDP